MKTYSTIILLLLFYNSVYSQLDENSDYIRAKEILDKVSVQTKKYENIFLEFTNAISNETQGVQRRTSNGTIYIKENKYKITFLGNEQIFDGEKIYRIIKDDLVIEIYNPEDLEEDAFTPKDILTLYETGYTFRMDKFEEVNDKHIQTILLYPENAEDPLTHVELGIDINKNIITHFIQFGKNGTNTEYHINKFNTNLTNIDSVFIFNSLDYKSFEIIDLSE